MAFPTTTLLDDFNRANNVSLGANWTEGTNGKNANAEIVSNAITSTGTPSSICAYTGSGTITGLWLAVETSMTLPTRDASTDRLGLAFTKVSNTAIGYHMEVDDHSGATDVGITFWNDNTGLQMGSTIVATGYGIPVTGYLQGAVAHDTGSQVDLEFWLNTGGTWTRVATMTASGGDYIAGPYYPAFRVKYATEGLDNFKAADATPAGGGTSAGQRMLTLGVG